MIGPHPDYVNLANKLDANYFSIPKGQWDAMTDAQRWAANRAFLDARIAAGDSFELAIREDLVRAGSYTDKEIAYLKSRGYTVTANKMRLLPPRGTP